MSSSSNIQTLSSNKKANRLKVYGHYINSSGRYVMTPQEAVKQEISIMYEEYIVSIVEEYLDEKPFGEGDRVETAILSDVTGSEAYICQTIYQEDYANDTLSTVIKNMLSDRVSLFSLKSLTYGSSNIKINSDLLSIIFSTYKSIEINLATNNNPISLPYMTINLDKFVMKNTTIKQMNSFSVGASEVVLDNVRIYTDDSDERPTFNISSSRSIEISNIVLAQPININAIIEMPETNSKWKDTLITVSNFVIVFDDDNNPKVKGKANRAILSLSNAYITNVNGVHSIYGIPYYKLISLTNGHVYNLIDIDRFSKNIPISAPIISANGVTELNVNGLRCISPDGVQSDSKVFAFTNCQLNTKISISKTTVIGVDLFDLPGLRMSKFAILDSECIGSKHVFGKNAALSSINKFIIKDSKISSDDVVIRGNVVSVYDSTISSNENMSFEAYESFSLNDTSITASELNVDISNGAYHSYTKTKFKFDGMFISSKERLDVNNELYTSNGFKMTDVNLNGKTFGVSNLYKSYLSNVLFESMKYLNVGDVENFSCDATLSYKGSKIETIFNNVDFSSANIILKDLCVKPSMIFNECHSNNKTIKINFYTEEVDKFDHLLIDLRDSVVGILLYSSLKKLVKLNSNSSLGSSVIKDTVTDGNLVDISCYMNSKDINSLVKRTDSNSENSDYVLYG